MLLLVSLAAVYPNFQYFVNFCSFFKLIGLY